MIYSNRDEYEEIWYHLTTNIRQQRRQFEATTDQLVAWLPSERLFRDVAPKYINNDAAGGLGLSFGFPGDEIKMRDKVKMKLWKDYFEGMITIP